MGGLLSSVDIISFEEKPFSITFGFFNSELHNCKISELKEKIQAKLDEKDQFRRRSLKRRGKELQDTQEGEDCKRSELTIETKTNTSIQNQRLLYIGKELEDIQGGKEMKLEDYGITHQARIFLGNKLNPLKNDLFVYQVKEISCEIKEKFSESHQILKDREAAILSELDHMMVNHMENDVNEQNKELDQIRNKLSSNLIFKESDKMFEEGIPLVYVQIRKHQGSMGTPGSKIQSEQNLNEVSMGGHNCIRKSNSSYQGIIGEIPTKPLENGIYKLQHKGEEYIQVASKFKEKWDKNKGDCPPISSIFKIHSSQTEAKFNKYISALRHDNAKLVEYYFHGCKIICDLHRTEYLCNSTDCTICQVCRQGFDIEKVGTNVSFLRFGKGLSFAPESSKCHDYTLGIPKYGNRAMFYVKCAPGFKQIVFKNDESRTEPDKGYNSIYGLVGGNLNYDELCLYNDHACVPEYVIVYVKDGVNRRCF